MYLLSQRSNSLYTVGRVWDGSLPSLPGIWGHSKKVAACKPGSESSPTCRAGPPWRTWSLRPVSIHVCILSCWSSPWCPVTAARAHWTPSPPTSPASPSPGLSPSVCALGFSLPSSRRKTTFSLHLSSLVPHLTPVSTDG